MTKPVDPIARITAALERLAPKPNIAADWLRKPAYVWNGTSARELTSIEAPALDVLRGIDALRPWIGTGCRRCA